MPKHLSLFQMLAVLEEINPTLAQDIKDRIISAASLAADAIADDLDIERGQYIEIQIQDLTVAFGPASKHDPMPNLIDMLDAYGDWDRIAYPATK